MLTGDGRLAPASSIHGFKSHMKLPEARPIRQVFWTASSRPYQQVSVGQNANVLTGFGSSNTTSAFGQNKTGFGNTSTSGGGLFSTGNNTGGGFGGSGGFGSNNNNTNSGGGFGASNTNTGGGMFGQKTSSFGAPSTGGGLFGNSNTNTNTSTTGGGFGASTQSTFGGGGGFSNGSNPPMQPVGESPGTGGVTFSATTEKEPNSNITNHFQSITFLGPFQKHSFEVSTQPSIIED